MAKSIPQPQDREKIKDKLIGSDPTRDYHATKTNYYGEILIQQLPPWRLWTGRMMLTSDPIVNFALNIRNAALMPAEVIVTSPNPRIKKWIEDQWSTLWNYHRSKLVSAKEFGFAPLQIVFKRDKDGLICVKTVKDFAQEDCRALEANGKLVGQRVAGEKLFFPQACWLTFNAKHGSAYGTGCLRRSYPAWYEKWMDHGAKRLLQLRMIKDAYIGDIFWYPPDLAVEFPDGTKLGWRDMVRELAENRLSGGAMTLPMLYDEQGKKLTDYSPPQDIGTGSQIFDWVEHCDENILRGADVPFEVVKASDTGSGYSGRSIPFMVVLSVCTQELIEIVQCVNDQVLRPMAWLNFGGDPDYEIVAQSLVESFSKDTSGSAMGGAAIGGAGGVPQQVTQQYAEQATGGDDYTISHNPTFNQFLFKHKSGKEIGEIQLKQGIRPNSLVTANLLVWPEFQRKGYATKFYKHAAEYVKSQGKDFYLSQNRSKDAKALHEHFKKQGWLSDDGKLSFDKTKQHAETDPIFLPPIDAATSRDMQSKARDEFRREWLGVDDSQFSERVPKILYRGITKDGKGLGSYSLGKGLYSTPNKKFLNGFAFHKIVKLSPRDHYPSNPLRLRSVEHFNDWLLEKSGHKNIREFNKQYSDPGEFVASHGYDGVHAGDEVVKYPTKQNSQHSEDDIESKYLDNKKYHGHIPEIKHLPTRVIHRREMDFRPEVQSVLDDVAKNMDYSHPIEATAFRDHSKLHEDGRHVPEVTLEDGHHRVAAAIQTGRKHLPVNVHAVNAYGSKIKGLIRLSRAIESQSDSQFAEHEIDHDLVSRAKKHFGETSNHNEAGYMLHDGTMLDFSGRHIRAGYTRDKLNRNILTVPGVDHSANTRDIDHRQLRSDNGSLVSVGGTQGMHEFMHKTGAIRLLPEYNYGIHVVGKHHPAQIEKIVRHVRTNNVPLLIDVTHGNKTYSHEFARPTVEDIEKHIAKIRRKRKTGEMQFSESDVVQVPLSNLFIASQNKLYSARVKHYQSHPPETHGTATLHNGRYYLTDGHHRVAAAIANDSDLKHVSLRVSTDSHFDSHPSWWEKLDTTQHDEMDGVYKSIAKRDYIRDQFAELPEHIGASSVHELGKHFETGKPVEFRYLRNTETSPNMGKLYHQHIEPHGRYLLHADNDSPPKGWEHGTVSFKNPLVIKHNAKDDFGYDEHGWKARLAKHFNATGRALSKAIVAAGHDGIVTTSGNDTSEIVDLTNFK